MTMQKVFAKKELHLTAAQNRLAGLNPKSVLNRGYSITVNKATGKVLTDSAEVEIGALLMTELARGNLLESEVKNRESGLSGDGICKTALG